MNSVWLTSPFVKFNTDNLIYNETLCPETHFLNKFARDKHRTEDQNASTNNERQGNFTIIPNYSSSSNLLLQDGTRDENIEENFTITANGSSCLKLDSKIVSRKTKSRSTLSERSVHSQNVATSSNITDEASSKIHEMHEIEAELSSSNRTRSINYSKMENDVAEDIENDLSNCPFELVQIYPGNKENDLDRTFFDVSREGSSLAGFPKKSSRVAGNDAAPLTRVKCGQCDESCESCMCSKESKTAEDVEKKNETFKLNIVRDIDLTTSSDDSEKSCLTAKGKKRSKRRSRKVLKRSEELMNYLDHETKKMDFLNDSETKTFVSESEKTLIEDLIGMEERRDKMISSLVEADARNSACNACDKNNVAKSRCDPSNVNNSSDNDFFRRNSTVIDANRRKLDHHIESINFKDNLQTVTERREEGKNILNKIGTMREKYDRENGGNRTGERKITEYAIDDVSDEMIEKSAPFGVDYRNIKICNLLSRIHEQLFNNFQKMESIWILLQDSSPIESVRSAMPLRLLVRIISRCKSYIHDSHDSEKAESKIIKCLLSLVIDLAKSVDQNKLDVERQEQQLEGLLLKLYQEKNLYKKRIMINEVVSVWDHVLREISDIMQDISNKLRTVITESEEKENVRNSSFRRKDGVVESRGAKASLIRKESNIETQMAVTLNKHNTIKSPKAKTATKLANTPRQQDVEKLSYTEPLTIGERKMTDLSLSKYNASKHPKSKASTKSLNIQRCQDIEKLSCNELVKNIERKMYDNISLSRYNATKHPKSKPSTKSLNIQRCQDVEKLLFNESVKNIERKMQDNISLCRYNATKHPKSKPSTKSLNIQRCQDVEKLSFNEPMKIVERKVNNSARCSEKGKMLKKPTQSVNLEQSRLPIPRQKCRLANNQQPVWRPGGVVKLPSSSSVTNLALKHRPLLAESTERSNQLTDNNKEGKHGRSGDSKKKIPNSSIDSSKQSSRRYIMNPESTSKLKPKSRALKVCFKEENESSCRSVSTCSERALSERVNRQKTSKEAKVLKLLEEIIKSGSANKQDQKIANKSVVDTDQNQTNSIGPVRSAKPISIEEEIEIPQDEPTRDIDPNEVPQSRSKHTEVFNEIQQFIEKFPEYPVKVIPPIDFSSSSIIKDQAMDSNSSVHFESSRPKNDSNFTCKTDCATELKASSSYTVESPSFSFQEDKLESQRNSSINVCSNSQKTSLTMLKEILRGQGVDVGFLNKAEQCVKNRQKWDDYLKMKSVSLADVVEFLQERGKCSSCPEDMLEEIVRSCGERNSEDLEDAMKSLDENCKENLELSEEKDTSTGTEAKQEDSAIQMKRTEIIIKEDAPLKQEHQTRDSISVKPESQKNSSSINVCSNSQTTTLTMLKEFLRSQGVDVKFLNKLDGCLKMESVNLANLMTANKERSKYSEDPIERRSCQKNTLEEIVRSCGERNSEDLEDAMKSLDENCKENLELSEEKDTSTGTEAKQEDSAIQMKRTEIIIKEDAPLKQEHQTRDSISVKPESQKNSSSINVCSNSQTTTLTMLKEFLRSQGVDVKFLNKLDGCLKMESVNLANLMTANKERSKYSEDPIERRSCQKNTLEEIVRSCGERNSEDLGDTMKRLDENCKENLDLSEEKDTSTGTEEKKEDSAIQMKRIEIIIEEDAPSKKECQKDELNIAKGSISVKPESQKNSSSINVCSNSQTTSLIMLKEFLRSQGVDVKFLNKLDGCLKMESVNLADPMTSNKERSKCSEDPIERRSYQGDTLKEIVQSCEERNSEDLGDAMKNLDENCKENLDLPEEKDTSTGTETKKEDSSVQMKRIEIIIEEDAPSKKECQKDELNIAKGSISVKPERQKNSRASSLTMLKEFLRGQGVEVDLLNKAEQCVKDRRKWRGCLKTKSVSLADVVTSNGERSKRSEDPAENCCCQRDMLKHLENATKFPEKKETSTSTETNNKDSSAQTRLRETQTKGIQIIIEEDVLSKQETETMETQTEMISIKHTATDCCKIMAEVAGNLTDASSMTEPTEVKDGVTETALVSKSNLNEEISDKSAAKFVEIWNETSSRKMCVEGERRCLRRSNSSDKVREQNGSDCELGFRESDSSTSSCCEQFPGCCTLSNCCAMMDSELNSFDKVMSSETIASLQSATIRARNMYRAIHVYRQHMESKLKGEEEKMFEEKREQKDLSIIDSIDVILKKNSYRSCKYDIEILSRAEIASLTDESEYETSESVSTPIRTVSRDERDVSDEAGLQVCRKSSSGAVLKVVESVMELLIREMDDAKVTVCARTISSRTCSKGHIAFSKKNNGKNESSISPFSRQYLLMLIYGVVCSIVFWCLQFTITCDVVL